jgi:hypothetical protein
MREYAWLELYKGMWHLITDLRAKPGMSGRNWPNVDAAIAELGEEGWKVSESYQNRLAEKLDLTKKVQGFALKRTIN